MEKLKLIVAIANHGQGESMRTAPEGAGCAACFHLSGQGTAKAAWLEYLGLSDTRRDVLLAPCAAGKASAALDALRAALEPAHYFAATVSLSSIAGRNTYELLAKGGNAHG